MAENTSDADGKIAEAAITPESASRAETSPARHDVADAQKAAQTGPAEGSGRQVLREQIVDQYESLVEDLEVVKERSFTQEGAAAVAEALALVAEWGAANVSLLEQEVAPAVMRPEQIGVIAGKIGDLTEQLVADGYAFREAAENQVAERKTLLWVLLGLSFVCAIGLAAFMNRNAAKPLQKAVAALKALSSGDLSVEFAVSSKDEIGDLANVIGVFRESLGSQ